MQKSERYTTQKLLEKAQSTFQEKLANLYEDIGLQACPKENVSILIENKIAFDLHTGHKYFGVCRPADYKRLEPMINRLEQLWTDILDLKHFLGYTGNLKRSFLIPQIRSVTSGSVTLSVNQTHKIIPIKAGQLRELSTRHPGEPFFKKLLESGHYQHLGTQYLTSNFRFALLGQPQAHVKGGVLLINESGKPLHVNFRFSGILTEVSRADKIQDRPNLKMTLDNCKYEFFPKSNKAEDLAFFSQLEGIGNSA